MNEELRKLKRDPNALDQSIGLNRILLALIDNYKRSQRWLYILLVVSLLCNLLIAGSFVYIKNHYTVQVSPPEYTSEGVEIVDH